MEDNLDRISIAQFKNLMKTLDSSMNDYLYIMDLKNDYYCISKNAAGRFLIPGVEFHNVVETHKMFVLPEEKILRQKLFLLPYNFTNMFNLI